MLAVSHFHFPFASPPPQTVNFFKRFSAALFRYLIITLAAVRDGFAGVTITTEPIFALRMLQENYREKNKELHMGFVDLEKAYD